MSVRNGESLSDFNTGMPANIINTDDSIERERNKLVISGYVHPETKRGYTGKRSAYKKWGNYTSTERTGNSAETYNTNLYTNFSKAYSNENLCKLCNQLMSKCICVTDYGKEVNARKNIGDTNILNTNDNSNLIQNGQFI